MPVILSTLCEELSKRASKIDVEKIARSYCTTLRKTIMKQAI